jgi:hypothetical protein
MINKIKALEITKDRIDSLNYFTPENESEKRILTETLEYLKFIKEILENDFKK